MTRTMYCRTCDFGYDSTARRQPKCPICLNSTAFRDSWENPEEEWLNIFSDIDCKGDEEE